MLKLWRRFREWLAVTWANGNDVVLAGRCARLEADLEQERIRCRALELERDLLAAVHERDKDRWHADRPRPRTGEEQ